MVSVVVVVMRSIGFGEGGPCVRSGRFPDGESRRATNQNAGGGDDNM
jgi:hypothetical protein